MSKWILPSETRGHTKASLPSYKVPKWRKDPTTEAQSIKPKSCSTAKRENIHYTGTFVKGIATMHKSNAIPILNQEDAINIAKMRR